MGLRVRISRETWMSLTNVCCDVEVSAMSRSLFQRSPTEGVCHWVWSLVTVTLYTLQGVRKRSRRKNKGRRRNLTRVSNPGLQGQRPATNSQSHGKASKLEIQLNNTYAFNSYPVIRTIRLEFSVLLIYTSLPHRRPQTPTTSRDM
jgi:hypothetical protein